MLKLTQLLVLSLLTLSGCASYDFKRAFVPDFNYFTDTVPTVESVKSTSHGAQIYRKTTFFVSDFKENGEAKSIYDYDFSSEDAPCTVLGEAYHESPIFQEAYYTVSTSAGKPFVFECRPTNDTVNATRFRLFLIGAYHECQSRRWEYKDSTIPYLRDYGRQCSNGFKTKANTLIDAEYKDAFSKHAGIVVKKPRKGI